MQNIYTRSIRWVLLCLFLPILGMAQSTSDSQTGKLVGHVTDESGENLVGASVVVLGTNRGTNTDSKGNFTIAGLAPGDYTIRFSFVGYAEQDQQVSVSAGSETQMGDIMMVASDLTSDIIVVSASKRPEKLTEAPSAISVITSRDFDRLPSFNVGELNSKLQGIEYVRTGVVGIGINARGFNSAFNFKIFQMVDGRNAMLPGGPGIPAGALYPLIKEDIERLEVVLGPNSALYGPNAHNGLANTITKDPFATQGAQVSIGGGNQSQFSIRARIAAATDDNKFAVKFALESTSGIDFGFQDTVYTALGARGERNVDYRFSFNRANAAFHYKLNDVARIVADFGTATSSNLGVTSNGRNQIRDWNIGYAQLRYTSPRLYGSITNTWNNAGKTYAINNYTIFGAFKDAGFAPFNTQTEEQLKTTAGFRDESERLNAEVQYNYEFDFGLRAVGSLNYQNDIANSFGTYLDDNRGASEIQFDQIGGAIQLEQKVGEDIKVVVAARLDDHDRYGSLFAPKLAVTYNGLGGTFRASIGRAWATPPIQFQDFFVAGSTTIAGNGQGVRITDLAGNTLISRDKLRPEENVTVELGYKGIVLENKLFVDIGLWASQNIDFITPLQVIGVATNGVNRIFKGDKEIAITTPTAAVLTYLNYGRVISGGLDLGLNFYATNWLTLSGKYSYFQSDVDDLFNLSNDANGDGQVTRNEGSLNAARHRATVSVGLQNLLDKKFFANITARWLPEYQFFSGVQVAAKDQIDRRYTIARPPLANINLNRNYGPLGGFITVDISAGYAITSWVTAGAYVTNLLEADQREFVGSPIIGRLYGGELSFRF